MEKNFHVPRANSCWFTGCRFSLLRRPVALTILVIKRNAVMQSQLINDLLDVTAIAAGRSKLNPQRVDVSSLIESSSQQFYPSIAEKRINLEREIESGIPAVYADRDRLVQVIDNLLANTIKFTPLTRVKGSILSYDRMYLNGSAKVEQVVTSTASHLGYRS